MLDMGDLSDSDMDYMDEYKEIYDLDLLKPFGGNLKIFEKKSEQYEDSGSESNGQDSDEDDDMDMSPDVGEELAMFHFRKDKVDTSRGVDEDGDTSTDAEDELQMFYSDGYEISDDSGTEPSGEDVGSATPCYKVPRKGQEGTSIAIDSTADVAAVDMKSFQPVNIVEYDFVSLEIAYRFYCHYARSNGFCVRKQRFVRSRKTGDILQQEFVCNRSGESNNKISPSWDQRKRKHGNRLRCGCKASFKAHVDIVVGRWYCSWFNNDHNHELFEDWQCGMQTPNKKLSASHISQMNNMMARGSSVHDVFRALANQSGGFGNRTPDKKTLHNQVNRQKRLEKNDSVMAMHFMRDLALKDDQFYVECVKDVETNRIDKLFWSDGIGRLSYQLFGDVLAFDATYKKNKCMLPLIIFTGVNNHNCSTIFAAALVSDEKKETYEWLLKQFLTAMKGIQPVAVITDGDGSMKHAIKTVLPDARHRLCAWHLLFNASQNIKKPLFNKEFKNLMYGEHKVGKFRAKWEKMVDECGLHDNKWVSEMYENRKMWATAHFRGHFFAGFRTTSRCECLHSELAKFVHSRYNLTDFLDRYHYYLRYMRFREFEDDCASMHGKAVPMTSMKALEMSASKHYTTGVLSKFHAVIRLTNYRRVIHCEEALTHSIYTVQKIMCTRNEWHVSFYPHNNDFRCSCFKMESWGIACEHIVAVLAYLKIEELPQCLILQRWTKGAKDRFESVYTKDQGIWPTEKIARCGALMDLYRVLADLNSDSLDAFNAAREEADDLICQAKEKKTSKGEDETAKPFIKRDFSDLNVLARVGSKGSTKVSSIPSGKLKCRRTIICSTCKGAGHNKATCHLRSSKTPSEYQTDGDEEDEIAMFG